MIKDVAVVDTDAGVLRSVLEGEPTLEGLVRHVEANRQVRQRRVDAGDTTSALKFEAPLLIGGIKALNTVKTASAVGAQLSAKGSMKAVGKGAIKPK